MVFDHVTLVLPGGMIAEGRLRVDEHDRIEALGRADEVPISGGEPVYDGRGGYLCPGFIDLHVHGALGRDAMEGTPEAFDAILHHHASGGTTALALTSVAAPLEKLLNLLRAARAWQAATDGRKKTARLLGVHVEGPYFSPAKAGAHRLEHLRDPTASETARLLLHADVITQVTFAPELPGALELIDALGTRGIIRSGGHSDAWDEDARAAFGRGMEQVTHLFNAMSSARRRGPYRVAGLLEYALSEPGLRCELIADGHHVSPTLLRMAYQAKGVDGICLVTDASPGTGLPDGSEYRFADRTCLVRGGVCLTQDGHALAGSRATMIDVVRNMVQLAGVPLHESIAMATLNPARALLREHECGLLALGMRADLTLLTRDLSVTATFVGGEAIYRPS